MTEPTSLEALLESAEAALDRKDWEGLRDWSVRALEIDPSNQEAAGFAMIAERKLRRPKRSIDERRPMTILFADMVGSTAMAASRTAEELQPILEAYFDVCIQSIDRFDGHITKFVGDGVMAQFGYPSHENDTTRAVLAGLEIAHSVEALSEAIGVEMQVRVGIDAGMVVLTEIGQQLDVMGSVPNRAERLQHVAHPNGVAVSGTVAAQISDVFALQRLEDQVLKGFSEPQPAYIVTNIFEAPLTSGPRSTPQTPIVGRIRERSTLDSIWSEVVASAGGGGRAAVISGEPGIGKSRLASHIASRASVGGDPPLFGSCSDFYRTSPFHPIRRMLLRRLHVTDTADGAGVTKLLEDESDNAGVDPDEFVPLTARILGLSETPGYTELEMEPAALADATERAIISWWNGLAAQKPTIVSIDDAQWADSATLGLLDRMAGAGLPEGLMLVITARPIPDVSDHLNRWLESDQFLHVPLSPLEPEERLRLARASAGAAGLSTDAVATIAERSDGNPLFIEELVRTGSVPEVGGPLPDRISAVIRARLDTGGPASELARIAAAAGRGVDKELLATVAEVDVDRVESDLDALTRAGIMDRTMFGSEVQYSFRHSLYREEAYNLMLGRARVDVHSKIGDVLARRWNADATGEPAVIALHMQRADRFAEAIFYYSEAIQAAQRQGAQGDALENIDDAFALIGELELDQQQPWEVRITMLRGASYAAMDGYSSQRAYEDFTSALAKIDPDSNRLESIALLIGLSTYFATRGDAETARTTVDTLRRMAEEADPGEAMLYDAEIAGIDALLQYGRGRYSEARARFEEALRIVEHRPEGMDSSPLWQIPNDLSGAVQSQLMVAYWVQGERSRAFDMPARIIERCRGLDYPAGPFTEAYCHAYLGYLYYLDGDRAEARRAWDEMEAIANRHGFEMWSRFGGAYRALLDCHVNLGTGSIEILTEASSHLRELGLAVFQPFLLTEQAELETIAGSPEQGLETITRAVDLGLATAELHYHSETLRKRAGILLDLGHDERARQDLDEAVRLAGDQEAFVFGLRAALDRARLPSDVLPDDALPVLQRIADQVPDPDGYAEHAAVEQLTTAEPAG